MRKAKSNPLLLKTENGWFIVSPQGERPRSLSELLPELARNMIRQHSGRDAVRIFGPYHWAAELIRRKRVARKKNGGEYSRADAINQAADRVGLDRKKLRNWMNRSRRHDR
jgi:hypothetical protein